MLQLFPHIHQFAQDHPAIINAVDTLLSIGLPVLGITLVDVHTVAAIAVSGLAIVYNGVRLYDYFKKRTKNPKQ